MYKSVLLRSGAPDTPCFLIQVQTTPSCSQRFQGLGLGVVEQFAFRSVPHSVPAPSNNKGANLIAGTNNQRSKPLSAQQQSSCCYINSR